MEIAKQWSLDLCVPTGFFRQWWALTHLSVDPLLTKLKSLLLHDASKCYISLAFRTWYKAK